MKPILSCVLLALCCIVPAACKDSQSGAGPAESQVLARASAVVTELKQVIQTDYEISPATRNGIAAIIITVEGFPTDFASEVEQVKNAEAVRSFEGDLWLDFEQPMDPEHISDEERASGVESGRFILATFNAKTGESR
jgi:hypothetical protein